MATAAPLGPGAPVVAIDVGGTTIKAAALTSDGRLSEPLRVPTPVRGPDSAERVLDVVGQLVGELSATPADAPRAVGLALPGIFDDETGVGHWSENLGWKGVDFSALTARRFALPVALRHDVRAAAYAERRLGAARDAATALVVLIGTGVSAALFIGETTHVARGYAGEIGHAVVVPGGEKCLCGNRGCLEATASAAAVVRRYERLTGAVVPGASAVLALADSGDTAAGQIWESALDALAFGLAHAISLVAPDVIVLGGGVAEAGDTLIRPLQARLEELVRIQPVPRLTRAHFGQDAGLYGSALAARDLLGSEAGA
ncbi:ROK family protein [Arthrobacter echini]|uniref:ROK family protein n=1 Tax=Arthrobacter echini TaxID=1529066 RepID=UPI001B3BC5A6|nr:ROK family protein [Arthrobacter echini]